MISNPNPRSLFTILVVVCLISACGQPAPTEATTAAPTNTLQPSPVSPTESATSAPTPTDQPIPLPSGRLLLAVNQASGGKYPDTDVDFFDQYRWVELPSMEVSPHPLLTGDYPIQNSFVTLSPDLAHLAFVREEWSRIQIAGNTHDAVTSRSVFLADPNSNQAIPIGQPITEGGVNRVMGCGDEPSWSANSQFFAFARSPDWGSTEKEHRLYIYDVASNQLKTVTIRSQQGLGAFALSPDGTQIAVTELESAPEFGFNIHLMNADGSDDRILVKGWVSSNLVWSPDGTRIFFKSDRVDDRNEPGIYSVDVATGATTLLAEVSEHAWCLKLSPDGSLLTYDDLGLMGVDPNGGEARKLLTGECDPHGYSALVWSSDSQRFAFVAGVLPNTQIFIMDRAGDCLTLDYHEDAMIPFYLIGWFP
ncbi:MAG: hypothetical protein QY306_05130 [Anaerolineales bacterium]|nr:MAG: hypothetical protein QY306_05130 [Anaerolineales bacterium]